MYNITKYNHTNNYLLKSVNNARVRKGQNKKYEKIYMNKTKKIKKLILGGMLKFVELYLECLQTFNFTQHNS